VRRRLRLLCYLSIVVIGMLGLMFTCVGNVNGCLGVSGDEG